MAIWKKASRHIDDVLPVSDSSVNLTAPYIQQIGAMSAFL